MVSATGQFTIRDMSLELTGMRTKRHEKRLAGGGFGARNISSVVFARRGDPEQQIVQFLHTRRFADNGVHFRGGFSIFPYGCAPAGHHDDWGVGGLRLDGPGHLVSIHLRHAQIRDDHFIGLVFEHGGVEQIPFPAFRPRQPLPDD